MGFFKSLGFAAASTVRHMQKDMRKQDLNNKEWNRQFDEIFDLELKFCDYLESVGSADILCNHDIGKLIEKKGSSAAGFVREELNGYKRKIREYLNLGGDPGLIYDYTEIDSLLEKLKYLKSAGYMHWVEDKYMRLDLDRLKEYVERDKRLNQPSFLNPGKSFDLMSGEQFELFCADLLRDNGFSDIEVTKGSGDQGVDILATKDFVKYGIQCKCYSSDVGNKAVQEAFAGKTYYGCHVAVVLANRYFTPSAKELAAQTGVILWDREKLIALVNQSDTSKETEEPLQQSARMEIEIVEEMAGGSLIKGVGEYEGQARLFLQYGSEGNKYWAAYDCEDDNSYFWEYDKNKRVVRKTKEVFVTY